MLNLEDITKEAVNLDPLPTSIPKLAAIASCEYVDLETFEQIVAYDMTLTSKLLRMANSASFSGGTPISTIDEAISLLGSARLFELAVSASVSDRLNVALPEYELREGELWRHSVAAMLAVNRIKRSTDIQIPSECSATALLHDVGKLVLARKLDNEILTFLAKARSRGTQSERKAEIELLGVHHGEIGGLIAQNWGLPDTMVQGIIYHHDPQNVYSTAAFAVSLANHIAKASDGLNQPADSKERDIALNHFGISQETFETLSEQVGSDLDEAIKSLS